VSLRRSCPPSLSAGQDFQLGRVDGLAQATSLA
jgi:hypothetical protein